MALVGVAAAFVLGCAPQNNSHDHPIEAMFFGDSITFDAFTLSYARQVEGTRPAGEVLIHALPGYTTREFLPGSDFYERANVKENRPQTAFIFLGTNDAFLRYPASEYDLNLRAFTSQLLEDGAERIVIITPPRVFSPVPPMDVTVVRNFLHQYVDVIYGICSIPDDPIDCGPNLYDLMVLGHFRDGVHPNSVGQTLIFDAVEIILTPPD